MCRTTKRMSIGNVGHTRHSAANYVRLPRNRRSNTLRMSWLASTTLAQSMCWLVHFCFRNDVYDLKFTLIRYNYINIVYGIIELVLIIILIFLCASFLKQIANEHLLSIFKMYVCVCTWVCKAHLKLYHLYMCVTYFMWRIKFNSHARHRIVLYGCLQMHIWYMVSNWKVFGLNAYNSTICTYVFKIASVRVRIYMHGLYA